MKRAQCLLLRDLTIDTVSGSTNNVFWTFYDDLIRNNYVSNDTFFLSFFLNQKQLYVSYILSLCFIVFLSVFIFFSFFLSFFFF